MKNILLTGASGGIGYAIARKFLENSDAKMILQYNAHAQKIESLKEEFPYRIDSYKADLSDEKSVDEFLKEIDGAYKKLDIIIHSAGISVVDTINHTKVEDISKIINVNLKSPILITQKLVGKMIEKKSGVIIFISSMWGITGSSCESVYSATKGGIIAFSNSLSKELGPSNIRVNSVSPGFINTAMNDNIKVEDRDLFVSEIPLLRAGEATDVSNAIYFLCSDEASYISGANLRVDGGYL
ncbi:MAG: SDR family oxidoreductase [Ezakiella sp.]|uniref:elongation factor P 5-aminopentanone reductase n=1 Tax=Ezakiella sp. TaxID=1935205 RepID=UPI00297351E9|nr:SDR family oxidoreductase [Ezakiella sp.]MDD7730928.1 SDR family oxidoreductase [Eubacteriales bacterium]MDY6080334.1 SDR family oxidoreductase [Ezakiella sp.]